MHAVYFRVGASEADQLRWKEWRSAHSDHERTWQHIEAVETTMICANLEVNPMAIKACDVLNTSHRTLQCK
ncbi:DUF4880 domain-containing protein [Oxalicibacterium faecigallinarum]|uniref:DUF4880 domain-containing protein n=1 Tax=Oxalicibacterium faecigallinarum TaxID=573741 RepID=UPI0016699AFF